MALDGVSELSDHVLSPYVHNKIVCGACAANKENWCIAAMQKMQGLSGFLLGQDLLDIVLVYVEHLSRPDRSHAKLFGRNRIGVLWLRSC